MSPVRIDTTPPKTLKNALLFAFFSIALFIVSWILAVPYALWTYFQPKIRIRKNSDFELGVIGRSISLVCFSISALIVGCGLWFLFVLEIHAIRSYILLQIGITPFWYASWKITRLGSRLRCISVAALLREDKRPPILYLRRFVSDLDVTTRDVPGLWAPWWSPLSTRRIEEEDLNLLKHLGPVLAVAKPGEKLPLLGASRIKCSDANWKNEVEKYMAKCQLVVIRVGVSDALVWELEQAFSLEPFVPILLCISPTQDDSLLNVRQQYEWFRSVMLQHFPATASRLPLYLGSTRYFFLVTSDRVLELNKLRSELLDFFQPGLGSEIERRLKKRMKKILYAIIVCCLGLISAASWYFLTHDVS
jgi:hypothetical protein